jgi:hypothetical protein
MERSGRRRHEREERRLIHDARVECRRLEEEQAREAVGEKLFDVGKAAERERRTEAP